jgi:hypothetical protein
MQPVVRNNSGRFVAGMSRRQERSVMTVAAKAEAEAKVRFFYRVCRGGKYGVRMAWKVVRGLI